jgi:hypothetical protein
MIKELFKWYIENQDKLVSLYDGKVLVIKGNNVVGSFDSEESAYFDSISKYKPGTFIIQKCTPGEEAYTQTFHSMVSFA